MWLFLKGLSPLVWLKLAGILVFAGFIGAGSWYLRGIGVESAKAKAVKEAVAKITAEYQKERELRIIWQQAADGQYAALMRKLDGINRSYTVINQNIKTEIARDPKFYGQQLPPGGYKEWMEARKLAGAKQ